MSFRNFYKTVCAKSNRPNAKDACKTNEQNVSDDQWWTKEKPYMVREDLYRVPTILNLGNQIFLAKDLNNKNREQIMSLFELQATEKVMKDYGIGVTKIISSTAIDLYSEPISCYPLKVLVEVSVNVD